MDIAKQIYAKFDAGFDDPNMSKALDSMTAKINQLDKKSFKALILDATDRELSEITSVLEQVAAMGCNFVFDLDHKSRQCGALTVMKQLLRLPSIEVTADDIHDGAAKKYADLSLDELQKGLTRLYVLMRGDDPAASLQAPKLQTAHVHSFLVDQFNKIELSRPMVLFVVSLARTTRRQEVEDMVDTFQKAWYTSRQGEVELLTCWFTDHKATLKCIADDQENVSVAPCEQLAHFFSLLVHERQRGVKLPASSGEIHIADAPRMTTYLDVFDIDKGENCISMEKDVCPKVLGKNAILDFLRGNKITPLALHFFETGKCQTYVYRCTYDTILELTRKELNSIKDAYVQSIVKLYYDVSAGGTTAAMVVLWRLRKEFPCVELFQLTDDAAWWIRYLYRKTQLPLCILIDQGRLDVNEEDVREFFKRLQNCGQAEPEFVKAVALLVQPCVKEDALTDAVKSVRLSNNLSEEDRKNFDKLYASAALLLNNRDDPTDALHGLCQFGTSYYWLDGILSDIKNCCTGKERSLLLLCTVSFIYTRRAMPLPMVARVLEIQTEEMWKTTRLFSSLKLSANLLLLKRSDDDYTGIENGLIPVSQFVAGKILEIVFDDKKNALPQFIDAFLALLTGIRKEAIRSLIIWSTSLFLHRCSLSDNEQGLEKFAKLIKDLEDQVGKEETGKYLKKITSNISSLDTDDGPHMQAMYARYLAYKLDRYDDSLNEMAKALRVRNKEEFSLTRSNDSGLLTTAGHLLSCAPSLLSYRDNFERTEAQKMMRNARIVLRRAREIENNVYPFLIEASLLYQYMNSCYISIFNKNKKKFTAAFARNDHLLESAAQKARIILDELEFLLQRKYMHGFNETILIRIEQIRCNILFLVRDIDNVTLEQYKDMCDENSFMTRGIVDFCIIKMKGRLEDKERINFRHSETQKNPYYEKFFEKLTADELTAIVEIFHNDIQNISAANCRYAILATIRLCVSHHLSKRFFSRQQLATLAMLFAKRWIRLSPHDNRGYYYRGIMHLVNSLDVDQANSKQNLNAAREDFTKCQQLLKENEGKQQKHRWEMQFLLSTGCGLGRLEDRVYRVMKFLPRRIMRFTGYIPEPENQRRLFCKDLDMFVIIPRSEISEYICKAFQKERQEYKFVVRIHPEGLFAEDIRPHHRNRP